jgi:hypothetical protein
VRYLLFIVLSLHVTLIAAGVSVQKSGYILTQWCVDNAKFDNCHLENFFCGEDNCFKRYSAGNNQNIELVLYTSESNTTYKLHVSDKLRYKFDRYIGESNVSVTGELDDEVINVTDVK